MKNQENLLRGVTDHNTSDRSAASGRVMCGACVCSHAETHGCHATITFLGYGCNCCCIGVHVLHKLDEWFKEARLLCFHSVKLKQTLESLRYITIVCSFFCSI
jgi:hypothetical protein